LQERVTVAAQGSWFYVGDLGLTKMTVQFRDMGTTSTGIVHTSNLIGAAPADGADETIESTTITGNGRVVVDGPVEYIASEITAVQNSYTPSVYMSGV
jgi:alpha-D-ribose 1-methylphosphonate 5-triphosphate synthase subunit PhnG